MTTLLDGKAFAARIRAEVAEEVKAFRAQYGRVPGLAAVLVGGDPASHLYVAGKVKACDEVGMVSKKVDRPADLTREGLFQLVDDLNHDPEIDGFIVQLPLPAHLPERDILERINPDKDADGFHPSNVGRLWLDRPGFAPATPFGVIRLLKDHLHSLGDSLAGKNAVIVGRSSIVGKPMAALLVRESATVTIAHSKTKDLPEVCRRADILVAAVGRPGLIGPEHVRPGAIVIDVGINRVADQATVERLFPNDEKKLAALAKNGSVVVGDVDFTRVAEIAGAITPVPGGVGPLTIAMLLANTLEAAKRREARG